MKKIRILIYHSLTICLFLLLQLSCLSAQQIKLKIIETSDVHGAIFPYNFTSDRSSTNSLAQVHAYVEDQRSQIDREIILIDNGDIIQGDPSVYYYNFENTNTKHLYADVMNYMKYDAATVGNHDIEPGHAVYDKFKEELIFPWLAANAINTDTGKPYFQPYHIIERKGLKIAVLGLITPGIPNWLPENIWSGIIFEDMIETARKWVPIIEEKENPDLLIGLFHAGVDFTYDNQTKEMPRNENASELVAAQVPGFDIVFVGHDHQEWNYKVENCVGDSVLIMGPTSRARSIAEVEIDLTFKKETEIWESKIKGKLINTKDIEPDSIFLSEFYDEFDTIKEYVSRPIGEFTETISAKEALFGNSSFVDLIHKIQLQLTDADISFTAPLSLYSKLSEGKIYVRDMFNLYRYENLLYTMELSGKEIKDYLEYSYSLWFNTMNDENDHLLKFEKNEDGKLIISQRSNAPMLENRYYNFDSAEGIYYKVDVTSPPGERITITELSNGKLFELDEIYKVAINSYRGNGGGGHLVKGSGIPKSELSKRILNSTEKDLRYYMMKWIEEQKSVSPVQIINWSLVPGELVAKAKIRDYKLMFDSKY